MVGGRKILQILSNERKNLPQHDIMHLLHVDGLTSHDLVEVGSDLEQTWSVELHNNYGIEHPRKYCILLC